MNNSTFRKTERDGEGTNEREAGGERKSEKEIVSEGLGIEGDE